MFSTKINKFISTELYEIISNQAYALILKKAVIKSPLMFSPHCDLFHQFEQLIPRF